MIAPDVNPLSVHVRKINRDLQRNVRKRELFFSISLIEYPLVGGFIKIAFGIFNREVKYYCAALSKDGRTVCFFCVILSVRFFAF